MVARRLARTSAWALVAATGLQVVVHALYALRWLPTPDAADDEGGEQAPRCVDPPCGPESLPPPELLLMVVPFLRAARQSLSAPQRTLPESVRRVLG